MSARTAELCDQAILVRFLADQLSDDEQQKLEHHLDSCPHCCEDLQQLAADGELWKDVREQLSSESFLIPAETGGNSATPLSSKIPSGEGESLNRLVLSFLSPTDDPRMMGRLGNYEIAGIVGYGGMGIVLKGYDSSLNRYAAVKVLAPHLATSGAAKRRFQRESQAAAAVVHDNVIEIFGVAEASGIPYLAMPYVRGVSLERRIREQGPLQLEEILRISLQTASGLAAAHAQGLVHRDVKPANILLADGVERVKLTDFGLARAVDDASLTKSGVISGTPQYMSPEQARGEAVDGRSDLFSLGSVMYAMCTGRPPFRAETSYGILRRVTDCDPRPVRELNPSIPDWLECIISKLHAKQVEDRFATADEVSQLLEDCLAHVQYPTKMQLPTAASALCRPARRPWWTRRSTHVGAGVALLVLGAVLIVMLPPRERIPENESRGEASVIASSPDTNRQTPPASAQPPTASGQQGIWNDGVDSQLDDASQGVGQLDQELRNFWGDRPVMSSTLSKPVSTTPAREARE